MSSAGLTEEQWPVYERVIADCYAAGLRFAIGGGLAIGVYTGVWRDTKDIDFYVLPQDRAALQEILTRNGLVDYYDQLPYDRAWIYRSIQDKVIVDVIWAMANHSCNVDERWILDGPEVTIRGVQIRIVPPEEMIWAKLYVLQRDRCDWPDVLNILYTQHENLDWERLLDRLGEDAALLHGALLIFRWMCPAQAEALPSWLWSGLDKTETAAATSGLWRRRAELLDRRRWFAGLAAC
jgi:hypothetical protein